MDAISIVGTTIDRIILVRCIDIRNRLTFALAEDDATFAILHYALQHMQSSMPCHVCRTSHELAELTTAIRTCRRHVTYTP